MNKLHPKAVWLFFFHSAIALFFLVPFLIFVPGFAFLVGATQVVGGVEVFLIFLPIIMLVFIGGNLLFAYLIAHLTYENWKYQMSDNAVKIEKGIIWKKYISIPYERIQNVDIYRGVFARMLGLSDLQIQTAGYSAPTPYAAGTEGRLPGLDQKVAEQLRDDLIKKIKSPSKQGL